METLRPITGGRAQSNGLFLRILTGAYTPSYSAGKHFLSCLLVGEASLRQAAFLPVFSIKLFTHTHTHSLSQNNAAEPSGSLQAQGSIHFSVNSLTAGTLSSLHVEVRSSHGGTF